jgi:hypothetical protein
VAKSLAPFRSFVPTTGWKWESREGPVRPDEMATTHLFHTLRMIWNNSMPAHMQVGRVRLYDFPPDIYTVPYMRAAVMHIGRELFSRYSALNRWQKDELRQMAEWLAYAEYSEVRDPKLGAPQRRLTHEQG